MAPPPTLSATCLGWAFTANYTLTTADNGDVLLRSETDPSTRYFIRRRGADRLELTQADDETASGERPLLFVARIEVIERHLLGLLADDIRDDLGLPFLSLQWDADALAEGFELGDMVRGYRTLTRTGHGPLAAAPDPTLSLVALVPLSHLLLWPIADLKASFLSETGAPLLHAGSYAPPPRR
ncbi:Imm61 family immunity protein [Mycobacterium sp. NPDC049093]